MQKTLIETRASGKQFPGISYNFYNSQILQPDLLSFLAVLTSHPCSSPWQEDVIQYSLIWFWIYSVSYQGFNKDII